MTIAAERLAVIAAVTLPVAALSSVVGMNVIVNDSTQVGALVVLLVAMAAVTATSRCAAHAPPILQALLGTTDSRWRRNLVGEAPVQLRLRGRRSRGTAEAVRELPLAAEGLGRTGGTQTRQSDAPSH